jgi:hypothetical protein
MYDLKDYSRQWFVCVFYENLNGFLDEKLVKVSAWMVEEVVKVKKCNF